MSLSIKSYFLQKFFLPDTSIDDDPAHHGIDFERVLFPSTGGLKLDGLFLKTDHLAQGTVVHCHGNAGNLTTHFGLTLFLVRAGYNVFTFDYQGYGKSEGHPSPDGIIEDTLAALRYVRSRKDINPSRLALFGQSLGGAAAAGAMARDQAVRALILEATFTTYRQMAKVTNLGHALFFLIPFLIPDVGPLRDLPAIPPRPLLIVHGNDDQKVPVKFSEELYGSAPGEKRLCVLKGVGHLDGDEAGQAYDNPILRFLADSFTVSRP